MKQARALRTTLVVTLVVFASKGAGFIRDIISAGYFATGIERDAYASAYSLFYLPVLLFNSCITSTIVPLYVEARNKQSIRGANRFASNCIGVFAAFALVTSMLMMFCAEPLVHLIYAGFSPEKRLLTAQLTQIMLPSLMMSVVSIVMASVLNANDRFLAAQLTGFPLSIAVIVATVGFSERFGIQAVAWGVFAAGVLQVLVLIPPLKRSMHYTFRMNFKDARIRRMLVLALPAILSMAVNELNHMIDKSLASFLNNGDIAAMDYAYRLITFATGVLAVPLTTVMFSRLAQRAVVNDRKGMGAILTESVETLSIILLPITAMGFVLSDDIIRLAYMHGRFGEESVRVTSAIFRMYLLGITGFGLRDVFGRAFHALQDTKTPMRVACVTVAANIVLNLILSRVLGASGLALATTISCALGAIVLLGMIYRRLPQANWRRTGMELCKILLASGVCCLSAYALHLLLPQGANKLGWLLRLLAGCVGSGAVYVGMLALMRVRGLRMIAQIFRKK